MTPKDRVALALLDLPEVSPTLAGVATLASFGIPLGFFEVDLLLLGLFGAGSGVLLRASLTFSLLFDLFLYIFVEMSNQ
jgi:hypothetical protein